MQIYACVHNDWLQLSKYVDKKVCVTIELILQPWNTASNPFTYENNGIRLRNSIANSLEVRRHIRRGGILYFLCKNIMAQTSNTISCTKRYLKETKTRQQLKTRLVITSRDNQQWHRHVYYKVTRANKKLACRREFARRSVLFKNIKIIKNCRINYKCSHIRGVK